MAQPDDLEPRRGQGRRPMTDPTSQVDDATSRPDLADRRAQIGDLQAGPFHRPGVPDEREVRLAPVG